MLTSLKPITVPALALLLAITGNWTNTNAEESPKTAAKPAAGKPGQPPEGMVLIAAGEYIMGSTEEQVQAAGEQYGGEFVYTSEKPQRKINVAAFHIDIHPVTNKLYKKFLDATGYRPQGNRYQRMWFLRHWSDGSYPPGKADHPVTYITWHDAKAYAEWKGKRLPTEVEFEKAARGTDGRLWPWGDEFDVEKANIRVWGQEALADTTPVGSYPSGKSPFGLMDAAGNVFEWTSDLDPEQLKKGAEVVVLKGGSWKSYDSYARCAFRQFGEAAGFGPHIGFRCAKSP